jgi:hypothetical protein
MLRTLPQRLRQRSGVGFRHRVIGHTRLVTRSGTHFDDTIVDEATKGGAALLTLPVTPAPAHFQRMVFTAHRTRKAMTVHLIVHLAIRHSWYAVGMSTGVTLLGVGPHVALRSGAGPVFSRDHTSSKDHPSRFGGLNHLRPGEPVYDRQPTRAALRTGWSMIRSAIEIRRIRSRFVLPVHGTGIIKSTLGEIGQSCCHLNSRRAFLIQRPNRPLAFGGALRRDDRRSPVEHFSIVLPERLGGRRLRHQREW